MKRKKKRLEEQVWQNYREEVAQNFLKSIASDFESLLSIMATYTNLAIDKTGKNSEGRTILNALLQINQKANELVTRVIDRNYRIDIPEHTLLANAIDNIVDKLKKRLPDVLEVHLHSEKEKFRTRIDDPNSFYRCVNEAVTYILNGGWNKENRDILFEANTKSVTQDNDLLEILIPGRYDVLAICRQNIPSEATEISINSFLMSEEVSKEDRILLSKIQKKIEGANGIMTIVLVHQDNKTISRGIKFYFRHTDYNLSGREIPLEKFQINLQN